MEKLTGIRSRAKHRRKQNGDFTVGLFIGFNALLNTKLWEGDCQ